MTNESWLLEELVEQVLRRRSSIPARIWRSAAW